MLSQIPGGGIPSIDIVIAHLRYLSSQGWNSATNLESYIKDVIATYKFLEEQVLDQKILEDGRLWCNQSLDAISTVSKDQFRLAWMDSKSLRTILVESTERRKFSASLLNGFPNLLKAIGLEQIASQLNDDTRNQVVPVAEIQELWEQERFCDVELNIRGETFKAHRIVLAAASGYWKRVFTSDNESRKLDIEQNCSKDTVLGVLRYMYTAKLPDDVAGTSGRFVEFLKLAREWEVVELRERLEEMLLRVKGKAAGAEKGDKRFNTVS